MTLARFAELWSYPDHPPQRVTERELCDAEERLSTGLPKAYRDAVLLIGIPYPAIALLDTIVENELDLADVSEFLDPENIVGYTLEWRKLGLDDQLIAFANDCTGNLFCFGVRPAGSDDDSVVYFFDHDFGETKVVAKSFADWIDSYCNIVR